MDKSKGSSAKDQYLVLYNTVNTITWFYVLVKTVHSVLTGPVDNAFGNVGEFLKWTQTSIFLELLHVLLGLVRSSLLTTAVQVYSRLWIVWGITDKFVEPRHSIAFPLVAIAWSITEVVRYSYYVVNIKGSTPAFLSWLRYNTFFILYPVGASSEWWLMYRALDEAKAYNINYYYLTLFTMAVYPFGFPNQYLHMISQRRKMMRGKAKQK